MTLQKIPNARPDGSALYLVGHADYEAGFSTLLLAITHIYQHTEARWRGLV